MAALPEPAAPAGLVGASTRFAGALRAAGVGAAIGDTLDFVRALGLVDLADRDAVRAASRAIFVRRREDLPTHDAVFDAFWIGRTAPGWRAPEWPGSHGRHTTPESHASGSGRPETGAARIIGPASAEGTAGGVSAGESATIVRRTYSADEVLRRRDFERMTADELRQAEAAVAALALSVERRRTRRSELDARGALVAPRHTFRRSLATGGEMVDWVWRSQRLEPRPVTLLIDVSGSMELHARLMLRFAHVLARVDRRTEVFVFGTRLTRVTRQLAVRDVDRALERVAAEVHDWSGGTRIGESLREFNRRWVRRTRASEGSVVVLSDGWDRGDPQLTSRETERLRRNCRRLLWLNPLAGAPGFEPLAAGMAAAVGHVDALLPAGSLHDLDGLARVLADTRWGREARVPH